MENHSLDAKPTALMLYDMVKEKRIINTFNVLLLTAGMVQASQLSMVSRHDGGCCAEHDALWVEEVQHSIISWESHLLVARHNATAANHCTAPCQQVNRYY
jgi:hypothetical protein